MHFIYLDQGERSQFLTKIQKLDGFGLLTSRRVRSCVCACPSRAPTRPPGTWPKLACARPLSRRKTSSNGHKVLSADSSCHALQLSSYLTLVPFNSSARAGGTGGAPCARWRAGSWRSAWGLGGKGGAPLHLAAGGGLGGAALKKLRVAEDPASLLSLRTIPCRKWRLREPGVRLPAQPTRSGGRARCPLQSQPVTLIIQPAERVLFSDTRAPTRSRARDTFNLIDRLGKKTWLGAVKITA